MENETILITGGTGSLGRGLIQELLARKVKHIRIFARNEYQMVKTIQEISSSRLEPVIGDIRDRSALLKACEDCHTVFHLAALKHVPICEKTPSEAIATNVLGTQNVIDCAAKANVAKVIYVSTDKAIHPNCTYGCSKLLGEKLILSANERLNHTKYMVFRSGNLLGSVGSVIPIFQRQIALHKSVTLTDERMTRFFITIEKAAKLLVEIAIRGAGGEIFIPVMPSLRIKNIAAYLLQLNRLDEKSIHVTGMRPGEKLHEQMVAQNELNHIYQFNKDLFLYCSNDCHAWEANHVIKKTDHYIYDSKKATLSPEETAEYLLTSMS